MLPAFSVSLIRIPDISGTRSASVMPLQIISSPSHGSPVIVISGMSMMALCGTRTKTPWRWQSLPRFWRTDCIPLPFRSRTRIPATAIERTEESFEENTVLHADNDEPGISCEKSKKDSLNNGKNSSTIDINPVMDKTENSNLSSDSSKERSVGPKEIAVRPERFYINAKSLLDYLSKIIGVDRQSESLRYYGELLPDGKTLYVDLTQYEVIPYGG